MALAYPTVSVHESFEESLEADIDAVVIAPRRRRMLTSR